MNFAYDSSFEAAPAEAYERLIHDAASGDHTLFPREDGVERAWEVVGELYLADIAIPPGSRSSVHRRCQRRGAISLAEAAGPHEPAS